MPLVKCVIGLKDRIDRVESAIAAGGELRWTIRVSALSGRAWLEGFFRSRAESRVAWRRLAARLGGKCADSRPRWTSVRDRDWRESYRIHFKPWSFGRVHWVPIWKRATYRLPSGALPVWLDPGMAFGTGSHPTTRLCCERLVQFANAASLASLEARDRGVIDVGCGSGILAITAARLGLKPVVGFDRNRDAVRISRHNAARNRLSSRIRWFTSDLASGLAGRKAGLVVANIEAEALVRSRVALAGAVCRGGWLVLGGLLSTQVRAVRAAFTGGGSEWAARTRRLGEWADLLLVRRV